MAVDKNLFMYELAVVAIMKNEGPYIKEWLDYHLLAGVNHFYVYDNESPDNQKEILQPYIDAGIVTYIFYPGKARQYEAYNDAVLNFRFFCRYMAFIDADEFIFPQSDKNIVEVVDDILSDNQRVGGVAINWHQFGSNNLEKADYSRGVLERFTRRASDKNVGLDPTTGFPAGNAHIKIIANPRKVEYFWNPHFAVYFFGLYAINENGLEVRLHYNNPPTVKKIVINHYPMKSREEYEKKVLRGVADGIHNIYEKNPFAHIYNEEFDEEILKYREVRKKILIPKSLRKKTLSSKSFSVERENKIKERLFKAVCKTVFFETFSAEKIEDLLICLAICEKFQFKFDGKLISEKILFLINQALHSHLSIFEWALILNCLAEILRLPYSVTEDIRKTCLKAIPIFKEFVRLNVRVIDNFYGWRTFSELTKQLKMLETFDFYTKK